MRNLSKPLRLCVSCYFSFVNFVFFVSFVVTLVRS